MKQTNLELAYQGQAGRPFESHDVAGNRFQLVLRGLSDEEAARARRSLPEIEQFGVPNYFDQQRFGSVGQSGDFIARAWCAEDYERAIWLLLADPNPHDRPEQKAERQRVRQHWGNWSRCAAQVHHSPWREVVAYLGLRTPATDGAVAEQIRPNLRSLYAAAFQSFLWNRRSPHSSASNAGRNNWPIYRSPAKRFPSTAASIRASGLRLASAELPLPSARIQLEEGPIKAIMDRVTAARTHLGEVADQTSPRTFFSKGQRPALVFVEEPQQQTGEEEEPHRNRRKMTLTLKLPRGSYATKWRGIKRLLL